MKLFNYTILITGIFAEDNAEKHQSAKVTKIAHIDIEVGGNPRGTVDIGLFGNEVPKTVKNFESFCKGWNDPEDGSRPDGVLAMCPPWLC